MYNRAVLFGPAYCACYGSWRTSLKAMSRGRFFYPFPVSRPSRETDDKKIQYNWSGCISVKLGITGSRNNTIFDFTPLFTRKIKEFNDFLGRRRITAIITGGARGIDRQAENSAKNLNIPCQVCLPDYARFQRGAPLKRNLQIIEKCDALLVIWNGDAGSRGTVYTAMHALESGKSVFVIIANGEKMDRCIGEIHDKSAFAALNRK